jgi:AcrR family transcriptional regulator
LSTREEKAVAVIQQGEAATPAQAAARPLRADARRNRARVLDAAREAFAAEGLAVPLDDIARRAGVGAGTVYRHFPTKEALFEAVIVDRLEYLAGEAQLAVAAAVDAGASSDAEAVSAAFFDFLSLMVADASTKKDLADALAGAGVDLRAVTLHAAGRLRGHLDDLLARAQAAGAVRADVDSEDLHAVVFGALAAEQRRADSERPGRIAALICDGLRPLT